jgi:hypothetical protein
MIYHYTKGFHLPSILASSILVAEGEKPILWFTTNELWENTIFVATAPTLTEAHEFMLDLGGLLRISCDNSVALHRWKELREVASIPSKLAVCLYASAIRVGSRPGEWRGSLDAVPVEAFRMVDVYDGHDWVPAPDLKLKAARQDCQRSLGGLAHSPAIRL